MKWKGCYHMKVNVKEVCLIIFEKIIYLVCYHYALFLDWGDLSKKNAIKSQADKCYLYQNLT